MILSEIKKYLGSHSHATLGEIANHCGYDKTIVKNALDTWIDKGYIVKESTDTVCKDCKACCYKASLKQEPLYSWKK